MKFRAAAQEDLNTVYALYRSVIGTPYCVWNAEYPGWEEIQDDFSHDNLFVMAEGYEILGAISIVPQNELDDLPFWKSSPACEIARVVVSASHQGQGIAAKMVQQVSEIIKARGISAIHLLAAQSNPPAQKVYRKCGFREVGTCHMFGHDYLAFEKIL